MGDAAEALIDADSRIQERMDELQRERAKKDAGGIRDPERVQAVESLRLARTELERQLEATTHEGRRVQLQRAIDEIARRMVEAST